jgi:hypothetical protein
MDKEPDEELDEELDDKLDDNPDEELEVKGVVSSCNVGKSSESKDVTDLIPLFVFKEFIIIKKYIINFYFNFI